MICGVRAARIRAIRSLWLELEEPELEPKLEPELEPKLEPELEPKLEPELEPKLEELGLEVLAMVMAPAPESSTPARGPVQAGIALIWTKPGSEVLVSA